MEEKNFRTMEERKRSYINHIAHINNIPNPDQIQYLNYPQSIVWSFSKGKKRKTKNII